MIIFKIISKQYTCNFFFTDCWIFCTLRNFDNQSPKMQDTIFLYDHLVIINRFYIMISWWWLSSEWTALHLQTEQKQIFAKSRKKQIQLNQSQCMFNFCSWCLWPKLVVGDTPLGNNSIPAPRICHLSSADLHDIAITRPWIC